jgi:hypothetical protein
VSALREVFFRALISLALSRTDFHAVPPPQVRTGAPRFPIRVLQKAGWESYSLMRGLVFSPALREKPENE